MVDIDKIEKIIVILDNMNERGKDLEYSIGSGSGTMKKKEREKELQETIDRIRGEALSLLSFLD